MNPTFIQLSIPTADAVLWSEKIIQIRSFIALMVRGRTANRVVQIDMDMPKRCFECLIEDADDWQMIYKCPLVYKGYTDTIRMEGRLAECPLREVKNDGKIH